MGVIQRQSIKYTFIQYVGIAISALATIFIFPLALDLYGLVQAMIAAAAFISPLIMLGTNGILVKFFPEFKSQEKKHHGIFSLSLLIAFGGFLLFVLVFPLLKESIYLFFFANKAKIEGAGNFVFYILPLTALIAFLRIFALQSSNYQRIVIPAIFEEFLIRLTLPLFILLFYLHYIGIDQVLLGVILTYTMGFLGLGLYLKHLNILSLNTNFKLIPKKKYREIFSFGLFGLLNGLGAKTTFFIDTLMVSSQLDFTSTGVYNICVFIANSIVQPVRSIAGISQPIISKAFKENNMEEIRNIYKKSSLNLLIFGIFLFLLIWCNIEGLFSIMSNTKPMMAGRWVVLILGMTKLIDMATSINFEIIYYSRYYRFNLFAVLTLGILNVIFNLWLIPLYGINGAAIATFLSVSLFNLAKFLLIWIKFKMIPFTPKTVWVIFLGLIFWAGIWILPKTEIVILDIAINSALLGLLYPVIVYKLKISPDFNVLLKNIILKYIPFLGFIL
jgi:O-antigen/teichoic acid export membrane protein